MDTSQLYWLPFKQVYQQLQGANRSGISSLNELLNLNFQWLLDGLSKFSGPNEKSLSALKSGGALKASAWGAKRGIAVDKHLANATAELCQLLDLDELQCHLLLKRWLKDSGTNIPAPTATAPPAAAGTTAPLALPAPASAAGGTSAAATSSGQAVLSLDIVQGVSDSYAQERIYLSKCQQFIVMTAMDVTADASKSCRDVLRHLLEAGWEAKAFDCLANLLKQRKAADTATAGAAAGTSTAALTVVQQSATEGTHVVKPFDFEQRLHLHQLHERCELMCLLTQLYCGPDPSTSSSIHVLLEQLSQGAQDDSSNDATAAAFAEVQGIKWPECSEERLQQLLELLGDAVFVSGGRAAAVTAAGSGSSWQQRQQREGTAEHQLVNMQQLAEALGCSLILSALKPAQLLNRLAAAAAGAGQGPVESLPASVCPFKQWRSIEAALMQWRCAPGSVLAMLVLFAYNQLLANYRGMADAISSSIQQHALQAGGFAAITAPLSQEELAAGTLAGGLYRGLLLQGLCLMAAAFDLSPWHLPGPMLQQLVELVVAVAQGSPHLAEQVWDESLKSTQPLRHLLDEASALFPAYPAPFLQLSTGLCQGRTAAAAAYSYLCNKPCLTVEYDAAVSGVQRFQSASGEEAILHVHMPWAKAPEVQGSYLPEGSRGSVKPVPAFAQQPIPPDGVAVADSGSYLVAWDVQAEEGIGPVLLLARAAHCLQQLHVANVARQAVASSEYWQDLRLILQLLAALLKQEPLLAKPLLEVSIVYTSSQRMDWLDVIIASLNVLPALAAAAGAGRAGAARAPESTNGVAHITPGSAHSNQFCQEVLAALGDCLVAAAAAASAQPSRVVAALGSSQLFAGVALAPDPLPLVGLEGLAGWAQGQQTAEQTLGTTEDWRTLETLQALQESVEVPSKSYPLTKAVLHLVQSLLDQQCTWGMVPSLVSYILHRVLGAMPWLPFSCGASRMSVAAAALNVVRAAVMSGAVARPGAAGPKATGAPGGLLVTVLAAKVIHEMATAGHGYLSAVLPLPADALRDMAEQQAGSSQLLAAGTELAEALLLLVPVLLGSAAHLSPEMPLQQYWGADPPGGGMSPVAVIASYATYPYAPHLPLLALDALNAFAILQASPATAAGGGLGFSGAPPPSSGGPPVPTTAVAPAGLGPLTGPVQAGLNPAQPYIRGYHSAAAAGLGVAGRGGAAGWRRPSGLFAALLAAVPELRASLLRPFDAQVAQEYPEWSIKSMALLEAGVRFYPEVLDSLCFPSGLKLPQELASDTPAAPHSDAPAGAKPGSSTGKSAESTKRVFSALDGLWQLLKHASTLMASQPKLLAAVLRVLSTLWECQGSAHGAVELLRSQAGFWPALKACLPLQGTLPSVTAGQDDCESAAWKLQVHASALHILLLELLSVQVSNADATSGGQSKASAPDGHEPLLAALGPKDVMKLLANAAGLGLQQPLMDQLARMLQVSYLQLGGSAVVGAWGPASLKTDGLSIAAQFRAEVQPLLAAAASGEYTLEDLNVACNLLADPERATGAAFDEGEDDAMDTDGAARSSGARATVLVDSMYARPFGEALLSYAAVTPFSWAAGETEYGRQFLFDSGRLLQLLGPFVIDELEGTAALAITLDDISAAAAAAHARLALLQAATSLFASLSRHAPARQQLMSIEVSRDLLEGSVQGVSAAMSEACRLSSCPAARLLSVPWGLPFIGHAYSTALLLASRSMLLSVRLWKVAAAAAVGPAGTAGNSSLRQGPNVTFVTSGRPVLMARSLNEQQIGGLSSGGKGPAGGGVGSAGAGAPSGDAVALSACAKCAVLLSQWLRGRGGESLAEAAAAAAAAAAGCSSGLAWEEAGGSISGAVAADVEIVECLSTSLLLMLQALPGLQVRAAAASTQKPNGNVSPNNSSSSSRQAGAKGAAGDAASNSNMTPAELLELETALLDLLPALCKACALAVDQQQSQQQQWWEAQKQAAATGAAASRQAYAAAMLQLLIEILQHQLPASVWLSAVSQQLALVPMLTAAAARAGGCGGGAATQAAPAEAAAAANAQASGTAGSLPSGQQGASPAAAAAAAAGAAVTDISVLELAAAVVQVPEGALQLWQQGLVPVLVAYCRQVMHTERGTGLLDIASLGLVGPTAGVYAAEAASGFNAFEVSAQMELSLSTWGAYMAASSSSTAGGNSIQTVKGLTGAAGSSSSSAGSGGSAAAAAAAGCVWSPRHQQWCLLLGLLSTLLQQLSKTTAVVDIAMQLLITVEPRLLLAVQMQSSRSSSSSSADLSHQPGLRGLSASGQSSQQPHGVLALAWGSTGFQSGPGLGYRITHHHAGGPLLLTLANLLESERALFFLKLMVPHLGVWQLQRPGSLTAFRAAAARLVEFVAAPSVDRSFRVSCAPLSPFERRLAKLPSGLEASDGWFKVCSAGGANNSPPAAAAAAAASTPTAAAAAAASPTAAGAASPGSPAASFGAIITAGAFSGSPRAAADSTGGVTAPGGVGGCSEYCARLCEAVYTACEHSLAFLLMTAPVVEAGEVPAAAGEGLGATWPAAKALTALQDQVLAVGTSMVQHPQAISMRRRRVAASCVRIAAAAGQLLEAVSPQRWSAGAAAAAGRRGIDTAAEAARRHERMTNIARAATSGL